MITMTSDSDGWDDYLAKMDGELQAAKTPADLAAVDATFCDTLSAAAAREEIGEARCKEIAAIWSGHRTAREVAMGKRK